MARRDDLKRLITIQTRRLQKLKEKEARKGVNIEVDDLIEIEDIEAKLEALQAELEQIEAEPEPEGPMADSQAVRPDLDSYLARAVTAFQERMTQRVVQTHRPPTEPYKFLYAFEIEDANIFFGRDTAVETLYRTILRDRLTILHAKSGAGKTSLLNAGLSPRLIGEGRLPVYARAYEDPVLAIKRAIFPPSQEAWPELLANLNLYDFLSSVCPFLTRHVRELVIILDQFEEFFIFWPERDHRRPFIDALADCYDDQSLPVRFIIALRKDYYSDLADFQRRIPTILYNEVRLEAMTREEAQTAITGPAARIGRPVSYKPELLDLLLADLTRGGVELPHLQIICTKLYEALAPGETTITLTAYERLGQAQGILSSYLNQVLDRFPHREGNLARETLKELVSSEATKRVLSDTALAARVGVRLEDLHQLLIHLVKTRLLRRLEVEGGTSYEIAHEYLIEEIKQWIDPVELEFKEVEELLMREVANWQAHGTLIPRDRLELLYAHREKFSDLDTTASECLMASALRADFEIEAWAGILGRKAEKHLLEGVKDARHDVRRASLRSLGLIWSFSEVSNLGSEDKKVRIAAVGTLGGLADPRGIETLIGALGDKDRDVQGAATIALVKLGSPAIEPLISALRGENRDIPRTAAEALGQLGDPKGVEPLIGALGDIDRDVRQAAAEALGQLGDPKGVEPLIGALGDRSIDVRRAATQALVNLGVPAIKPLLVALGNEDVSVHQSAVKALSQIRDPQAVKLVIAALGNGYSDICLITAQVLGQFGDLAMEPLLVALQDENSNARRAEAAEVLGYMREPRGVELLIAALRDKDSNVRQSAAEALGRISDARGVEPLTAALEDENSGVRLAAIEALGQISDQQQIEPFIAALQDKEYKVRRIAARKLGELGGVYAAESLIIALKDPAFKVRQQATEGLKMIGESAIEPLIDALLWDDESEVRQRAALALEQIGDARAVESLIIALGDKDRYVREASAVALEKIGTPEALSALKKRKS